MARPQFVVEGCQVIDTKRAVSDIRTYCTCPNAQLAELIAESLNLMVHANERIGRFKRELTPT